ncbi:MAG: pyridoxamine kinase [Candidatus Cloacimonetes bacterium]|nr:pyridoxamine kinase [Candidatus Cloacimonadota bacterium]
MNKIQRVAAVHDISGFGKSSLTVVIPILSTMGIQVCPLPTAVLSTISIFPEPRMIDLTDSLEDIISHWRELNLRFDAIYSGFLGSPRQARIVQDLIRFTSKEGSLIVVDPVMGDYGNLYSVFQPDIIIAMKELVKSAQVITPNLTEAAFLLDENPVKLLTYTEIGLWLRRLSKMGPDMVIITSVPDYQEKDKTCVFAYNKVLDEYWKMSCHYLPGNFPGTGDTFASIITGSLLQKETLAAAIEKAVNFIYKAIEFSLNYVTDTREGIYMEPMLPELLKPVIQAKIEKLDL